MALTFRFLRERLSRDTVATEALRRTCAIEALTERAEGNGLVFAASLSSTAHVRRPFGDEELVHSADAIDLSRATRGLPLLLNHNRDELLGRARDVRLEDGRLRADLHFSGHSEAGRRWAAEVRDGYADGISISYEPLEFENGDGDTVRITRWRPLEVSIATVPADPTVGVGRLARDESADATAREREALERGRREESERRSQIAAAFAPWRGRDAIAALERRLAADPQASIERARGELLEALGRDVAPLGDSVRQDTERGGASSAAERLRVSSGRDARDAYADAVSAYWLHRGGVVRLEAAAAAANPYMGWSLVELMREWQGITRPSWRGGRHELLRATLERAGGGAGSLGTGDFPSILENVANKSLLSGWMETEESWRIWTRVGNLNDFRPHSRVNLSNVPTPGIVPEGGEYPLIDLSDTKESIVAVSYGERAGLSRQAIVNDDVNAFTRIPAALGRAAARIPGDLAYGLLTSNPLLAQDGIALFAAGHNNDVAPGSGAPPSMLTLEAARVAMALQTDPSGTVLGVRPSFLLVPVQLEGTSRQLIAAEFNPAATAGTLAPNIVRGIVEVVSDHRLSTADPLEWFVAANPQTRDTVEVGFVGGAESPMLETERPWSSSGVEWKITLDVGAQALDFRGLYRNDGN